MLKLVGKDLLAARWILLCGAAVLSLYSLQPFFSAGFILAAGGALALAGQATVFFLEDRNKTEILYLSLPVSRASIVGARYLLGAVLLAAGGAMVFGIIGWAGALMHVPRPAGGFPGLLSIEAAALFFPLTAFFLSLYLPFYHRFSFGRGTLLFTAAGVLCAALGAAGLKAALSDAFASGGGEAVIFGAVRVLRLSLGTPLFVLAAAAAVFIPFLVSLFLSTRFYARREF